MAATHATYTSSGISEQLRIQVGERAESVEPGLETVRVLEHPRTERWPSVQCYDFVAFLPAYTFPCV
jgi:hypothetical protein